LLILTAHFPNGKNHGTQQQGKNDHGHNMTIKKIHKASTKLGSVNFLTDRGDIGVGS